MDGKMEGQHKQSWAEFIAEKAKHQPVTQAEIDEYKPNALAAMQRLIQMYREAVKEGRIMEQDTLFDMPEEPATIKPLIHVLDLSTHPNRCVREWGLGPEGRTCGDCAFLIAMRYSKVYFKCTKRLEKHSGDTDRRKSFQACAKFEQRTEETEN